MAADRIRLGEADVMIAAGTESMTMIPMMGHKVAMNPRTFTDDNVAIAYGMGITAEKVAQEWKVSREDQDEFAYHSHQKAIAAIDGGEFTEIRPVTVTSRLPGADGTIRERQYTVDTDEGPRRDTTPEALGKLRTVFDAKGSVTAGTSSQMSDGAGALVLVSERVVKELSLKPLAVFRGFSVAGVRPEVMGIGPIEAIPKVLKQTGIAQDDLDWIELNEAFAAQALAVIRTTGLNPDKVNPLGGAIALGHPLGATGAILAAKLIHGLHRRDQRYGMVTMCIGTGMGAAGIFERV
jgi:acetyl-CoA acyltransferase